MLDNRSFEKPTEWGLLPANWQLKTGNSAYKFEQYVTDEFTGEALNYEDFNYGFSDLLDPKNVIPWVDIDFPVFPDPETEYFAFDLLGNELFQDFEFGLTTLIEKRNIYIADDTTKTKIPEFSEIKATLYEWEDDANKYTQKAYIIPVWGGEYTDSMLLEILAASTPVLEYFSVDKVMLLNSAKHAILRINDSSLDNKITSLLNTNVLVKNVVEEWCDLDIKMKYFKYLPIAIGVFPSLTWITLVIAYDTPYPDPPIYEEDFQSESAGSYIKSTSQWEGLFGLTLPSISTETITT